MNLFAPCEIKFSPWRGIIILAIIISLPVISYHLGFLVASLDTLKAKIEKLDNSTALLEENTELRIKLDKAEQALSSALLIAGFTNSLLKCWEDRNAAREIIIQALLRKNPAQQISLDKINYQKKNLANGDVVRYYGEKLFPGDFDKNGYVFPHILQKMPVGIFVYLPDKNKAFIYNLKKQNMSRMEIIGVIPQQNLLLIR